MEMNKKKALALKNKKEIPDLKNKKEIPDLKNKKKIPDLKNKKEIPDLKNKKEVSALKNKEKSEVEPSREIKRNTRSFLWDGINLRSRSIFPDPGKEVRKKKINEGKPNNEECVVSDENRQAEDSCLRLEISNQEWLRRYEIWFPDLHADVAEDSSSESSGDSFYLLHLSGSDSEGSLSPDIGGEDSVAK